jgi:hypothetical protein
LSTATTGHFAGTPGAVPLMRPGSELLLRFGYEFSQIVHAKRPCHAIGNKQQLRIGTFLHHDALDVAEDIGLLATGRSVCFALDQDARVVLVGNGKVGLFSSKSARTDESATLIKALFAKNLLGNFFNCVFQSTPALLTLKQTKRIERI